MPMVPVHTPKHPWKVGDVVVVELIAHRRRSSATILLGSVVAVSRTYVTVAPELRALDPEETAGAYRPPGPIRFKRNAPFPCPAYVQREESHALLILGHPAAYEALRTHLALFNEMRWEISCAYHKTMGSGTRPLTKALAYSRSSMDAVILALRALDPATTDDSADQPQPPTEDEAP
jgi:hypothetical protein